MPPDRGGLPSLLNSILWFTPIQGKCNIDAGTLSRIPWDQIIKAEAVDAIFKAAVEVPDALMEDYAFHKRLLIP